MTCEVDRSMHYRTSHATCRSKIKSIFLVIILHAMLELLPFHVFFLLQLWSQTGAVLEHSCLYRFKLLHCLLAKLPDTDGDTPLLWRFLGTVLRGNLRAW